MDSLGSIPNFVAELSTETAKNNNAILDRLIVRCLAVLQQAQPAACEMLQEAHCWHWRKSA